MHTKTWVLSPFLVLLPTAALADDSSACATSYEAGQVARAEGQLRRARQALSTCTRPECADFIRSDCARWLSEVEAALPTVVLAAQSRGRDVQDVNVTLDGAPLVESLDGKAVEVEPGRHAFVFERQGETPVTLDVVISEGEKNRKLLAQLAPAPSGAPQPARSTEPEASPTPSRTAPAVLLGVAALGVAGFVSFGTLGQSQKKELELSCAPRCDDSSVESIQTKFLLADVSLGVAVVALASSAYLYFSAPAPRRSRPRSTFDAELQLGARGAASALRWRF